MKKKILSVLMLILCGMCSIIMFTGCSGFNKVQSVSYSLNGKWHTLKSEFYYETSFFSEDVSKEEYDSAPRKYKTNDLGLALCSTINVDGTYYDPEYEIGEYIYYTDIVYRKVQITGYSFRYIYVQEVSSHTIKIKYSENGVVTTYNVDAYRIVNFQ